MESLYGSRGHLANKRLEGNAPAVIEAVISEGQARQGGADDHRCRQQLTDVASLSCVSCRYQMAKADATARLIPPRLLLRRERMPKGPGQLCEPKLDGYRAIAAKAKGRVACGRPNEKRLRR